MTAATSRLRRRGIGAGVAALVGLSTVGFSASAAFAAPGFDLTAPESQVAGEDRFETAALTALATFPDGADTVVIANGDRVIDALSASYVAGLNDAPILLTSVNQVSEFTLDAITALGATNVIVVGDENSVGPGAIADLEDADLTITATLAGEDRFDTAAQVYAQGETPASTVFLARGDYAVGQVSPDALAAGPIAYNGTPILLTNATSLPAATEEVLASGDIDRVVFLGNGITQDVKDAVAEAAEGIDVETTIGGADRSETAALLAESEFGEGLFDGTSAAIANGERVDALAAGPWGGVTGTPILLTLGTNDLGEGTRQYLADNAGTLTTGVVFGDENSVPTEFLEEATESAEGGPVESNQTLAVTPAEAAQLGFGEVRQYSVANLDADTDYRITLVNANNISVDEDGVVSFAEDGSTGLALPGTVAADITVVNGISAGAGAGQSIGGISPTGGTVSFTVTTDAAAVEGFVPVVYVDGGENTRLELDDAGLPSEAFGLGGAVQTVPDEAATGAIATPPQDIVIVDKEGDSIVTTASIYNYDAEDNFFIGGTAATNAVTPEEFEAQLSVGDDLITGTVYQQNEALDSTFVLGDTTPAAPAITTVTPADTTATLTITGVDDADTVTVYGEVDADGAGAGDPTVTTDSDVLATATGDQDAATAGFQVVLTGLTASSFYDVAATQTVSDEESALSTEANADTTATQVRPTLTSAVLTTDEVLEGAVDSGDVYTLTFNRGVDVAVTGATLTFTDADGDTILVSSATPGTATTTATIAASDVASGTAGTETVTVTLTEDAEDRNAAGDGDIEYPLTLTAVTGITDTATDGSANITGGDVTIS
ncbi:hypothetical protein GCM10027586_12050 [Kineococcus gypseus]|uniref:cell wall-binding repeat-containing protein n=1 Tax=Kineococcus gypseus TaxID=1637102 RepID=UPI003D7ED32A